MEKVVRSFRLVFLLCLFLLAAFYLFSSADLFPAMSGDSAAHLIPILNLNTGHGFGAVAWSMTRDYDPTGQHRFLQYPPLFHLIVARVLWRPTAASLFICFAVFATISLCLYASLIMRQSVGGKARYQPLWLALACLSLCATSTWLCQLPSSGRPEALTTPLILAATLCILSARRSWRPFIAGLFIGVLGAMQIAAACLAGCLYSVYVSISPGAGSRPVVTLASWLTQVASAAAIALLTFVCCLLCSPYPLLDTLHGIAFHLSQLQLQDSSHFSVFTYFVFPAWAGPFYGLFYLVVIVHFLWWQRGRLHRLGTLNLGSFIIACWYFAVWHPNRCYNLLTVSPVLIALALRLVASLDEAGQPAIAPWRRHGIYAVYFGLFGLMSLGLVRQAALFEVFLREGVRYQDARTHLRELLVASQDPPVLFQPALWPLLDRYDRAYQSNAELSGPLDLTPGPRKPVLIVHQWYDRLFVPPAIPGYQLIWDDFIAGKSPHLLGIKLGTSMPGYAFAFYKPIVPEK